MTLSRLFETRPWWFVGLLTGVWLLISLAVAAIIPALLAGTADETLRIWGMAALVAAVLAVTARVGWRRVEPNGGRLRDARVILIPLLIAALPFALGLRVTAWSSLALLVVLELVNALVEELAFRGLLLRALLPRGVMTAALASSALFGLVHLGNIAYGASVAVTLLQVFGVACFGLGMTAVVLRGGALWPVILLHAISNTALRFSYITPHPLPVPAVEAIRDTLLLAYALYLLREHWLPGARRAALPLQP